MSRKGTGTYPDDWLSIAQRVKAEAGGRCIRCKHPHAPELGRTLTVHHLDMDKGNCAWWNLLALCQRCHLSIQARVYVDRPYVMFEHSEWFKPYVAALYAMRYLGQELNREEVEARLDELLQLERQAVLGVMA